MQKNTDVLSRISAPILDTTPFERVSEVFRLLDDPNGLRIFWLLCHVEECVTNIAAIVQMTSPAVSHHLKQLKNSGLILSRREGKEVYYKAADTTTVSLLHEIVEEMIEVTCPDSLIIENQHPQPHCTCSHTGHSSHVHAQIPSKTSANTELMADIHDYLMEHLDKRITIEQLSKQFLINPTTLKILFKQAYGTSLAAHMKLHRIEKAATLLLETSDSIQSIAHYVGYESQSKFTTAFKQVYQTTPLEYRKRHQG